MTDIASTLAERGSRYGSFEDHARIAQRLQDNIRSEDGWDNLAPDQKQALTVICDKVARMLNGDPNYRDNWHDIVGYAKLVDDRLARDEELAALGPGLPFGEEGLVSAAPFRNELELSAAAAQRIGQ